MRILDSNFFLENLEPGIAALNPYESSHLAKVFRARPGDSLTLCDGKGSLANAELVEVAPESCKVLIKSVSDPEEQPKIHLAISCLTDGGEEEIVFHAAQLPLAAIHLLRTERSLEPRDSDLGKLRRRMEAKSLVALKQSRKTWLTEIKVPICLNEFLESFKGNLIVCDQRGEDTLPIGHSSKRGELTAVLTGPEGGFSPAELEMMKSKGAFFLSLGATRLRSVSAPIFALAKIIFSCSAKTAL
jgi:16S rRNA (uracil1498-N3)-methyltransferase